MKGLDASRYSDFIKQFTMGTICPADLDKVVALINEYDDRKEMVSATQQPTKTCQQQQKGDHHLSGLDPQVLGPPSNNDSGVHPVH